MAGRPKGLPKTGGRVKGVPNNENKEFRNKILELCPDYHPIVAMAVMANDETVEESLRFAAHKEVAKYFEPQLKAIEHSNPDGSLANTLTIIREKIVKPASS